MTRGDADCIEVVRRAGRLLLGVTVIGELLPGFARGERGCRNRKELSLFLASPRIESPPGSTDTAYAYAHPYRDLKRKGRSIPTNDLWIAASCLELGAILFSFDAHFLQVDGLRVIRSWQEALP